MEQPRSERNLWPFFAAIAVTVIILAALRWSLAHPYGIHWDEADYLNSIRGDLQRLQHGMLVKLAGRILKSWGRPPAYRLLALPFLAPFGYHTTLARLSSLACFGLSSWFTYLAACRIASRAAGAYAVLIFALAPEAIAASIFFSTDAPLYLATSAMLYFLFVCWSDASDRSYAWIGLGLAVSLGCLSKATFLLIAIPVLAFALVASYRQHRGLSQIWKACIVALFVAGPWWLLNIKTAMSYAVFARNTVRNSLGSPSIATWARWLDSVAQCLLGHGVSILVCLIAITCVVKTVIRKESILNPAQRTALCACVFAGVPLVLVQLSGTNHLLRYITPSIIPLAIAIGVLADQTGWTRSAGMLISGILFAAQLGMIVYPVVFPNDHVVDLGFANGALPWRVMPRFDQWDWEPLQKLGQSCGLETPKISFLGYGRPFGPPQMEYPWVADATSTSRTDLKVPEPVWLWRYEDGAIDWQKVMALTDQSDMVLTAPGYMGEPRFKEDIDNEHNNEFADRLSHDPLFQVPVHLKMGRFAPVDVQVFLKRTLGCQPGKLARFGSDGP